MGREAGRGCRLVQQSQRANTRNAKLNDQANRTDLVVRVGVLALALCCRQFCLEFLRAPLGLVQRWPRPGEVLLLGQQLPDENREPARRGDGGNVHAAPGTGCVRVLKEGGP